MKFSGEVPYTTGNDVHLFVFCPQALKYEKVHSSRQSVSFQQASDLVSCELTKAEFAEALSLRAGSLFVTNMFNLVDANDNGYISFREFLDFFVIFSKGFIEV